MRAGGGFPPCDVVGQMVECYNAPQLAYEHLRDTSALLPYIVPELNPRGVLESAVRAYLSLKRLAADPAMERLVELVQDGEIPREQQAEFRRIVVTLRELVRPCLELDIFWRDGEAGHV